ncbi:(NiFe) hydrogenase maturation protein HypF [Halothece sp. PCC 7418]|uniref:carbamoyltransferase HypF n=1 Tax=Halothece sp. (strain PCC 7418) TaxID=65093 RepID=UPI0002A0694F|nr:carbamoyltransferase HypF [Halothece sp. PCC 7418]AFZ42796.1 (NiFe) hydrogenase maturation protein HypF [Halothece sp. PCC 7418]
MSNQASQCRLYLQLQGAVQGVGFRPFVYRLATELALNGWVNNTVSGVFIEVEGSCETLETFQQRLLAEKPPIAQINDVTIKWLDLVGYEAFEIRASPTKATDPKSVVILPDLATCSDCLAEIFNPRDRRYHYPFTNCTNCGPRYSIIQGVPYDRANTTMNEFQMCPACGQEYDNPRDRRFHAQPNACPECGPQLTFWGEEEVNGDPALIATAEALRQGKIVAVKGLGGFHLMVDAQKKSAVSQLRKRKQRPRKPFAVMYPSLEWIKADCQVSEIEAEVLQSPQAPIVLLSKNRENSSIAPTVAPNNPNLGVMLPYTPLHHLLLAELQFPVVATSGNLSNEPICTDETEARERLQGIADVFLVHNRAIARPVDDSVVRIIHDQPVILRRARGYAPFSTRLELPSHPHSSILAMGGHLKNTIALYQNQQVFLSQHIGDLETARSRQTFQATQTSLANLYDFQPDTIACDLHPDYYSSQYAQQLATEKQLPLTPVQHHLAHILACVGEHRLSAPVLGIAWDGTGYGLDGTIWGGEFILVTEENWQRVAHWRTFGLPGGEKAIKDPRRSALGLLYEMDGEKALAGFDFTSQALKILRSMLKQGLNTPQTSSVGRLFDAIAALVGLSTTVSFEGEAAMQLEFAINGNDTTETYPLNLIPATENTPIILDWEAMVREIQSDVQKQTPLSIIAAKFQNTLLAGITKIANQMQVSTIVFTGGCFQNKSLLEKAITTAKENNQQPYWCQTLPPNDGGIAFGQIIATLRELAKKRRLINESFV